MNFEQALSKRTDLDVYSGLLAHAVPGLVEAASFSGEVHTLFAPSDDAFAGLAASLGFGGGSNADVQAFLIATLSPTVLTDLLHISFVVDMVPIETADSSYLGHGGFTIALADPYIVDNDADSPDAVFLHGNLDAGTGNDGARYVHVISEVLLPYEITGNTGAYPVHAGTPTNGDDDLVGSDTGQSIDLKDGNNTYDGRGGNDVIFSGTGQDNLMGGDGDDQITSGAESDQVRGGNGNDFLRAGSGNDDVRGNKGDDIVKGDGGRDTVTGGAGNDIVDGGNGIDKVKGDRGDDTLFGGDGDDTLIEGLGDGYLYGGRGNDWMKGDDGADHFVFEAQSGNDFILDFEDGIDMLDMSALGLAGIGDLTITQVDVDTLIDIDGINTVLLGKTNAADIGADDFLFT